MAGGEGTRLRPLTSSLPKPMVPIVNKPAMKYIIDLLKNLNIKDIDVTTYYLPSLISDYFGNGEKFGVNLNYFIEEKPLGTGGSVMNIDDFPKDSFLVISGDCVTAIDIADAINFHLSKKSKATLILKREKVPLEYGIVILNKDGMITRFLEKPTWGEVFSDTINTGIYILEPEIFNYYNKGDNFDFSKDLFPRLLKDNVPMYGYVAKDYWCDVGDFNSYVQTQFDILNRKIVLDLEVKESTPQLWVDSGTIIAKDAIINPPVYIGKNCIIKSGAIIDPYTIIGDNCEIGEFCSIKKSIIWNNVHIGKNVQCRGTTICNNVSIKSNVNLYENSVIGSECVLSKGSSVKPDIKIWPSKTIAEGSTVYRNLVWGTKLSRIKFGESGIYGEINLDITPEYATILGSAFATIMRGNRPIIVSCDNYNSSQFIANCIISGIQSTGLRGLYLDNVITPISRFGVRFYSAGGGIHVRTNNDDNNLVHIELLNDKGGNVSRKIQKNIEQLFLRGDFERCIPDKISSFTTVNNFSLFYNQYNERLLKNVTEIKKKGLKIALSSTSSIVTSIAKEFFSNIGCNVMVENPLHTTEAIDSSILHLSKFIKKHNADLGLLLNDSGEKLIPFDNNGNIIKEDTYNVLCALITLKTSTAKKLIVPINTTSTIQNIAGDYNVEIIKSKSSTSDIMNEMLNNENDDLTQYILNFDGIQAGGKIIDYLISKKLSMSELLLELPDFHVKRSELKCDFESRGYIIRKLIEDYENDSIELFEGIKINSVKGWSLILPDNERPFFNIFTEGFSEEYATELTDSINSKIQLLINDKQI